ncbi:SdpI family protein [Paenibacillus sp. SI8]|uniref:SdpI family protein n=1 Tax=unclassified Paenibacillus TaxID=185978 RepID=UPI0034672EA0
MNKHTKFSWGWRDILLLIITCVPIGVAVVIYQDLPNQMASHFDLSGNVNGYMGKFSFIIFMSLLNLFLAFSLKVMPILDPKRANYTKFLDVYELLRFVIVIFLSGIFMIVLLYNRGYDISMTTVLFLFLGGLWIIFGNYMGRIRHNYTLGIRTPWTLASEEVWRRTHRLAAPLWVLCGLVMIFSGFFGAALVPYLLLFSIAVSIGYPIIYSFLVYRKLDQGRG